MLPITMIVLLISVLLVDMRIGTMAMFLMGAVFLVVGMGLFQLGAEMAMTPLGEGVGGRLVRSDNLFLILVAAFFIGAIITISEPDLQVLANQVASVPNMVLILTVAAGVGIFLALSMLRILLHISFSKILLVLYIFVILLSIAAPTDFVSVAFDAGGVTTGPITVPFIMALGVGLAAVREDKDGTGDSFGLIALCSVGPVIMVLLLGILYHPEDAVYTSVTVPNVITMRDVTWEFLYALPDYAQEILFSILPVIAVLIVFQIFSHSYRKRQLLRLGVGFVYTFLGLILFLTGVNVGFAPVGSLLGEGLADSVFKWLLIPIGALIGWFVVRAEPAVQVLNEQVEDVTGGTVSRRMMDITLSIGVAVAVALSMTRVLTGFSIYWVLIPGYAIALILTRFVPPVITGIAFDSGGVASGPMTSTFLLPLAMGACMAAGGNVVTDAFGIVALVALAPLIAVQLMGVVYVWKSKEKTVTSELLPEDDSLVDLEEDLENE